MSTRALSRLLGGEDRLEQTRARLRIHPAAVVFHHQRDGAPGTPGRSSTRNVTSKFAGKICPGKFPSPRAQPNFSAVRHRIARVQHQVQQDLPQLRRIDKHGPAPESITESSADSDQAEAFNIISPVVLLGTLLCSVLLNLATLVCVGREEEGGGTVRVVKLRVRSWNLAAIGLSFFAHRHPAGVRVCEELRSPNPSNEGRTAAGVQKPRISLDNPKPCEAPKPPFPLHSVKVRTLKNSNFILP
jgi:hypothetical protein